MNEIFLFLIVLILFNSSNVYALSDFSFSDISPDDFFGHDVEIIGDLDGDGVTDIAVGSPHRYYYDVESSPLHILLLEKDGKVKSFETLPQENNIRINSDIFYFLGIIIILAIIAVLVVKIKFKNRIKILKK